MCGIAALTMDLPARAALDRGALRELARLLGRGNPPPEKVQVLMEEVRSLAGPGSFPWMEEAFGDPSLEREVSSLVEALEAFAQRTRPAGAGSALAAGEPSPWEGLHEKALDLAWTLGKDTLGNLGKVRALLGPGAGPSPAREALFTAFQANLVLNSLGRLEVRGRDSAGIALVLVFPDKNELLARERELEPELSVELAQREGRANFLHGTILKNLPPAGPAALAFTWKRAAEVGSLGDNPDFLRKAVAQDRLFWRFSSAPGVRARVLAHTRWASNGVISQANCHPVADRGSLQAPVGLPGFLAVLNGDVDNFRELAAKYEKEGFRIAKGISTDAQVIPLLLARHYAEKGNAKEAFRATMEEMEGSLAVAALSLSEPDLLLAGISGSGQALFAGSLHGGTALASEVYGAVEACGRFLRLPGTETGPAGGKPGSILEIRPGRPWEEGASFLDGAPLPGNLLETFTPEISTRDIDLGGYDHFLIKELSQAASSFRKTISRKFKPLPGGGATSLLLETSLPKDLRDRIRRGGVKRIICLGQGTAAVAAQAVATLLAERLAGTGIHVDSAPASEVSGFLPGEDLSDLLVVAVSQSGTTTDTNRTVDLVRQKGASVLAIVNRRNSDLVFKADGVVYTSDGRDVEMSVASTKAFYSQVAAGQLLALALAELLGLQDPQSLEREARNLEKIPALLEEVFAMGGEIAASARKFAPAKRYWAAVGNGPGKVAAREIRIKLSELCYKSIPVDVTEDKKHIDLSTEPLVILCAAGLEEALLSDVVKEAAIFKAHRATTVVLTTAGKERFEPYAASVIQVPSAPGGLDFVPVTMAGHIWGYHAALALDEGARLLKRIRSLLVEWVHILDEDDPIREREIQERLRPLVGEFLEDLLGGRLDGGLDPSVGAGIAFLLEEVAGRAGFRRPIHRLGGAASPLHAQLQEALEWVNKGVEALLRPIDAIKHQAKTVTVGISRKAEALPEPFAPALAEAGVSPEEVRRDHRLLLVALAPLVEAVPGATLYAVENLGPQGEPVSGTTLKVLKKTGTSREIPSRADGGAPLEGSKWLAVKRSALFFGRGGRDGRPVLVLPLYRKGRCARLLLMHTPCRERVEPAVLAEALQAFQGRLDEVEAEVTERGIPWSVDLLSGAPLPELFSQRVGALVDRLLRK